MRCYQRTTIVAAEDGSTGTFGFPYNRYDSAGRDRLFEYAVVNSGLDITLDGALFRPR
jgi:hypothetical protein